MKFTNYSIVIVLFMFFGLNVSAFAANECRIQYGWNIGNSFQGTFKNKTGYLYINKGQTKTINKVRMNFVKNLNTQKVKIYLTNVLVSPITLEKNKRNPIAGTFAGTPKLIKVHCLNSSASSTSTSSGVGTASALMTSLKAAGKSARYIAGQLRSRFGLKAQTVANLFKQANYSVNEITQVLKVTFRLSRSKAQQILRTARFRANQIVSALNRYYGQAQQRAKTIVQAATKPVLNNQPQSDAARNLKRLGISAVAAAVQELKGWFVQAEIYKRSCRVTGPIAIGPMRVFGSSYRWRGLVKSALKREGLSNIKAKSWDEAYKLAFIGWAQKVTIPSLPWYPAFSAYPAPVARPMPNVQTPLGLLVSSGAAGMSSTALKSKIIKGFRGQEKANLGPAVNIFANQIGGRFKRFLAQAQVMNVFGSGSVPNFRTQRSGVVIGSCVGKAVLAAAARSF